MVTFDSTPPQSEFPDLHLSHSGKRSDQVREAGGCSYDSCVSPALLMEVEHCVKKHLVPLGLEHIPLQVRGEDMQWQEGIQGSFLPSESVGGSAF